MKAELVINEFIETECNYLEQLKLIEKVFQFTKNNVLNLF
jgi:hypothetical protein